jgi:hypothetical protein
MGKRLVWIVARKACDPSISLFPALAVFEPVRSEAHIEDSQAWTERQNIFPGAMAGSAEIHRSYAVQPRRVKNQSRTGLRRAHVFLGHVVGSRTVTGFARYAQRDAARIKLPLEHRPGGMAAKAKLSFVGRHAASGS